MRLGSFQNLYLSFAIVEITHGVTANRDDKMQCVLNSAYRWQCMSCMNVNGVMFFSLKDEMCLNDVQVVIDEVQRHE